MNKVFQQNRIVTIVMSLVVLGVVASSTSMAGNDRVSGRTVGMARTFVASSRGLDAMGLNPANLALDDRGSTVTFQIAPLGLKVGSDFINYQIYQDYFTGVDSIQPDGSTIRVPKQLSDADKQSILALFPGGIARTQANFDISEFGLSVESSVLGGFGFEVSDRVALNLDIPEGYVQFILNGLPPNGASYSLDNTAVTASWLREYNFSYARLLPFDLTIFNNISVGVGVKVIQGFGYFGTDHYKGVLENTVTHDPVSGSIDNSQLHAAVDFLQYRASFPDSAIANNLFSPLGKGTGFDVGVSSSVMFPALRFGVSVTDIGSINWSKDTKAITGHADMTVTNVTDQSVQDSVKNAFKGQQFDTTGFTTTLPTAMHIGASLQVDEMPFITSFPGRLLIAADLDFGFNNEPGNATTPRFALGMEYRPVMAFPIRLGISTGGRERFAFAGGFGINTPVWDLDLATESLSLLTNPNNFRYASVTLGMKFRI
ncbi:MAG: hypothetical protein KGJ59_03890 [Bacteroidota bacterium]|nr:hypothetical protein [Bacteroidota bacterium]